MALNGVLIPLFSQNGAAVASVITELSVNIVLLQYSTKIVRLQIDRDFMRDTLLAGLIMALPMFVVNVLIENVLVGLAMDVIVAVPVYFLVCLATKNDIFLMVWNLIQRKGVAV
jgi:O-antigen/teichoic acid export membrane protein